MVLFPIKGERSQRPEALPTHQSTLCKRLLAFLFPLCPQAESSRACLGSRCLTWRSGGSEVGAPGGWGAGGSEAGEQEAGGSEAGEREAGAAAAALSLWLSHLGCDPLRNRALAAFFGVGLAGDLALSTIPTTSLAGGRRTFKISSTGSSKWSAEPSQTPVPPGLCSGLGGLEAGHRRNGT